MNTFFIAVTLAAVSLAAPVSMQPSCQDDVGTVPAIAAFGPYQTMRVRGNCKFLVTTGLPDCEAAGAYAQQLFADNVLAYVNASHGTTVVLMEMQ